MPQDIHGFVPSKQQEDEDSCCGCAVVNMNDDDGPVSSIWTFVGPLVAHHVLLMIGTNYLLYQVRNVESRYQEQKYVLLAAMLVFEVLAIGIPVLLAVRDNAEASFIVLTGIIILNDIGILCCIFVPKMIYQRKGLEEGVGVTESILRESRKKAVIRETLRRKNTTPTPPPQSHDNNNYNIPNGNNSYSSSGDNNNNSDRSSSSLFKSRMQHVFAKLRLTTSSGVSSSEDGHSGNNDDLMNNTNTGQLEKIKEEDNPLPPSKEYEI